MTYTFRPYQSTDDLYEIGRLIYRAYAQHKHFNGWSVCRFDIWAQRRIADATSFNDHVWQEHFQLVSDENESLLGAAFAFDNHHWRKNPEPYALVLHPSHPQLAERLLDWAEADGMCEVEIMQGNIFLTGLIQSRGYTRSNDFMFIREKPLIDTPFEPVNLPPGYFVRILDPLEWDSYFSAVHEVFHMMDHPRPLLRFNGRLRMSMSFISMWSMTRTRSPRSAPSGWIVKTTSRSSNRWAPCRSFKSRVLGQP